MRVCVVCVANGFGTILLSKISAAAVGAAPISYFSFLFSNAIISIFRNATPALLHQLRSLAITYSQCGDFQVL